MKIVYGPVASWRLGKSLGVDLICSPEKICSFDCIYCQLEKAREITSRRDTFVQISDVEKEVKKRISEMAPGGGFIFNQVHNIQPQVPPENVLRMFDTAFQYGTYPISV